MKCQRGNLNYSLSIRRFWGKGERRKQKRAPSKISSPLAPWEGLIFRLIELSIIYLHSEAFSTKTTVSEVKYSGLVGLLEHARRLWHLNHIPAVCMYVVPFVRFLFNGNNSTYHLSLENHVDYVSLRDMENPDRFGFILQPPKQKKSVPSFHIFE